MAGVSIERLRPESWERLREAQLRALRDSPEVFARTLAQEEALGGEEWRLRAARGATLLASAPAADGLSEDVGIAVAAALPRRAGCATFGLWVAPAWRRVGLGGRLLDEVLVWARSAGFSRVVLNVPDDNEAAIGLYARKGFEPTGVCGALPPPRSHVRKHEMALELGPPALAAEEEMALELGPPAPAAEEEGEAAPRTACATPRPVE
mmetsp:Transcript_105159/g.327845  ORF Transcript_105159/g.327845 Transcript_105159/m.327845 type:complete len:208 (+) Transcript_105159:128-751(+)